MNKDIKYFGIDISHLVFDVTDSDGHYYQFKNSLIGFKKLELNVLYQNKTLNERFPILIGNNVICSWNKDSIVFVS